MYVGVLLIVAGWSLLFPSMTLGVYAAALAVAFHLRVRFGEEPWLARQHGKAWARYASTVPRWIGRFGRPAAPRVDPHAEAGGKQPSARGILRTCAAIE